MSNKEDSNDGVQIISQKLETVTTIEPNSSIHEQTEMKKINSTTSYANIQRGHQIEEHSMERDLPELNLPEKILLVVDTIREPKWTPFALNTSAKYSPFQMIKKVIEAFVISKSGYHRNHKFALMMLNTDSCHWICDFTNSIKTFVSHLNTISEDVQEKCLEEQNINKIYDLGQLFEKIYEHINLPNITNGVSSTFLTRVILVYSRSECVPLFHIEQKYFDELIKNPYFFFDSLYIHENPSEDNMCEQIYEKIHALDVRGLSYILEVGRNCKDIFNCMAKLTAHPLQRPLQKNTYYAITSTSSK